MEILKKILNKKNENSLFKNEFDILLETGKIEEADIILILLNNEAHQK